MIYMAGDFLLVMMKAKQLRDLDFPHCPYVCHLNGKPFNDLQQGWKVACRRVGLEGRTFHDLRRNGVRNLVRAGVSETVSMRISGHKTRSVFDRYNITNEKDLKEAAIRLAAYLREEKVTFTVTPSDLGGEKVNPDASEALEIIGGGGGIRTHGGLHHAGFQDRSIRPL